MKKYLLKLFVVFGLSVGLVSTAAANFISFNGTQVSALDLNGQYSSFQEFYGYNTRKPWSSNTGFELNDTVVMFLAELNGEYGLFATFSRSANGNGGGAGSLYASISSSSGSATFADDPDEINDPASNAAELAALNGSGLNFRWNGDKTDGFIFSELNLPTWNVQTSFTNTVNIDGLVFLSFGDGTKASATSTDLYAIGSNFEVSRAISTPATIGLFMGFLAFSLVRRKA
mmetsp:Transcript_59403/g.189222  ORF Transcript_59403/g.189222 Transcript_59403/m.189222 type:complete len:230 (+) Transcript_59403:112-801(+)